MKIKNAISDVLNTIDLNTVSDVDVRTQGGDISISPPEVILEWSTGALPVYNGANIHGGFTTDDSGDQDGHEYHQYRHVEIDCLIRSQDEVEAHDIATTIQEEFAPFEYDASAFNNDTAEWDVGSASPRNNPIVEPDWYEIGVLLEFVLMKRTTEDGDTLDTIQQPDPNEVIDVTLEDGDVSVGD